MIRQVSDHELFAKAIGPIVLGIKDTTSSGGLDFASWMNDSGIAADMRNYLVASQRQATSLRECSHCKRVEETLGSFKKCSRCKKVQYCGKECQLAAWKSGHKKECATG